jgi:serine/threonine protein kinase
MAQSFWRELFGWARRAESRRFRDFLPIRPVHDGEKACVYQARRMSANLPAVAGGLYALKVYKPGYDRTARRIQKRYGLSSEGETGLSLTPPTAASDPDFPIVRTFTCGWEYDDPARCHYLVQEVVDGANLKHMLVCADPRLRAKRLEILQAAGRALAFMHDQGLIHRDVCSDNILFSRDGRTKLVDLGFAAPAGIAFEEKSGTPSAMSPEQCQGIRLAPTSDIYSFGVVLFEVFTGRLPFSAARGSDNPALAARRASELMQKHLHDPPPRPAQVARDLPEGLEPIILRCLEKPPERRYPNMKELLWDLAKLHEREPEIAEGPPGEAR